MEYRDQARYRGRFTDMRVKLVDEIVLALKAHNVHGALTALRTYRKEMLAFGFNFSDMLRGAGNVLTSPLDVFERSLPFIMTVTIVALTIVAKATLSPPQFDAWYYEARETIQDIAMMMRMDYLVTLLLPTSVSAFQNLRTSLASAKNTLTSRDKVRKYFSDFYNDIYASWPKRTRDEFTRQSTNEFYARNTASGVLHGIVSLVLLSSSSGLARRLLDKSEFDKLVFSFLSVATQKDVTLPDNALDSLPYKSLKAAVPRNGANQRL